MTHGNVASVHVDHNVVRVVNSSPRSVRLKGKRKRALCGPERVGLGHGSKPRGRRHCVGGKGACGIHLTWWGHLSFLSEATCHAPERLIHSGAF